MCATYRATWARGLVGNTVPVAGGHRAAVAGDVFLWKYRNNQTGAINSIGHTQLVDQGRIRQMVGRAVREWGFRGIKVHGHDAQANREVCEAARAFRVPILVDVVGKAHVVEMLASQYPDVNFIIPHLGSFADDWRAHGPVIDQIARYPNVYADTSGVRRFDYLVEAVQRAGARAAREWDISLATPRVLAVDRLTERLETAIARLVGQEQALIFPSTTHAALDVLPLLAGPRGALFLDAWAYPLSVAGAYAATRDGARIRRFPHDDARALASMLAVHGAAGSVVVCDGVYPATGRPAALRAIERAARDWGARMYVDDAHGIGLLGAHPSAALPYGYGGAGTPAHLAVAPGRIIHVGSLSKALGLPVAFVAGPAGPIGALREAAPTYTHCSPPALPVLAAALAALQVHACDGDALRQRLAGLVGRFQRGLHQLGRAPQPGTLFPIQTLLFPTPLAAQAVARALRRQGIWAILQIGSNEHSGGALRFALTALHTPADIDLLVEALARHVAPIVAQADGGALSTHDTGSH